MRGKRFIYNLTVRILPSNSACNDLVEFEASQILKRLTN